MRRLRGVKEEEEKFIKSFYRIYRKARVRLMQRYDGKRKLSCSQRKF